MLANNGPPLMPRHHLTVKVNGLTDGGTELVKLKSIRVLLIKLEMQELT